MRIATFNIESLDLPVESRTVILRPALDRLTRLCYRALGLISFFTVGQDEVRAWPIRHGSSAPQAGRVIHSTNLFKCRN